MNDASAGEPCVDAVRARMRQDPGQVRSVDERQGFVWLASYPKSGSTWMRALLANFLARAGPAVPMDALPFRTAPSGFRFGELAGVAMEDFTRDEIGSLIPAFFRLHRRLCIAEQRMGARSHLYGKVHGAYVLNRAGQPLFPEDVTAGAVCIVRNPLDVAISWTFHAGERDFAMSVARLNDARTTLGAPGRRLRLLDWSGNVGSWCAAPFPVLVVRYEDLLADTAAQLRRVARFLRLDDVSDARLRHAVSRSAFANLREREKREGFPEKPSVNAGFFFREGRAGGWRRHLSAAEARKLVRRHRSTMAALGYDPADLLGHSVPRGPKTGTGKPNR